MTSLRPIINVLSNVHRGTAFEERSRLLLHSNLSMSLRRVGGKSDGGIDLLGWWWLPFVTMANNGVPLQEIPRRRIRLLAQCKAEKKKLGPRYVREMEGVLYQYVHSRRADASLLNEDGNATAYDTTVDPIAAVLISESPFTEAATLRAQSSSVPFLLLHLPPLATSSGKTDLVFGAAFWNPALAGTSGILGGQIEMRWERSSSGAGKPSLWSQDRRIENWTPEVDDPVNEPNHPIANS